MTTKIKIASSKSLDKTLNAAQFASLVASNINAASSNLAVNLPVLTKNSATLIINMVFETLLAEIKTKKTVSTNIGKFKYNKKAARVCKNFKTGSKIDIPEKGSMTFTLNSATKEILGKVL